jgi:5'-deoxynucleotidase YfbR-like HD superfamily hydrolase
MALRALRLERIRHMTPDINRWHCHPALRNSGDTVSAHSARVASLCHSLAARIGHPLHDSDLPYAALHHDAAEQVLGDMPAPAKARFPALAAAYAKAELQVLTEMGKTWNLTRTENDILTLCDKLDALMWMDRCGYTGADRDDDEARLMVKALRIDPRAYDWINEQIKKGLT